MIDLSRAIKISFDTQILHMKYHRIIAFIIPLYFIVLVILLQFCIKARYCTITRKFDSITSTEYTSKEKEIYRKKTTRTHSENY
jgi:hypothetical protein